MEEIFHFFFHEEEIIFHDGITKEFITFAKGGVVQAVMQVMGVAGKASLIRTCTVGPGS